ncbi:MAG: hypothetical protein M1817_000665 [Caeruleum heppii]|nr:MAG: hypothetical protein M1817_000665 [Caeruleum heppii]
MTEVLSAPVHADGHSYFSSAPLRRSSPSRSFLVASPETYSKPASKPYYVHTEYAERRSHSAPSTAPSSPRLSTADYSCNPSYSSTPASSLSLNTKLDDEDDQIVFPSYDDVGYLDPVEDLDSSVDQRTDSSPNSPTSASVPTTANPSRPHSPDLAVTAEDDTAVRDEPNSHVDYLSHDWKEEDIWASWRHIVSKRKVYGNSARLENASWRTWTKSKYHLKTVSPETLNWLKDCDVTWLYGPLQAGSTKSLMPPGTPTSSRLSKTDSFLDKKPILKKRSMSEIMLQRSLSASSLLKQAAAAVQAQQTSASSDRICGRPGLGRAASDFVTSSVESRSGSGEATSSYPSASSSGLQTPSTGEKRRIHFNNKVEQCIAVDVKDGEEEEEDVYNAVNEDDDLSSDDGVVMMKRSNSKAKFSARTTPRNSFSTESKTIAMLPSTTLKYREDADAPQLPALDTSRLGRSWSSKLSPSPSQETLRPSKPSSNFLLDDEDDDDMSWEPSGLSESRFDASSSRTNPDSPQSPFGAGDHEHNGLRRTPSGMFMPYEEDEDDVVAAGLFGRVVDTVNTAKDIAHVIWNVGWRG